MTRVLQHLGAHLDEPIDSAALSRLEGLSPRQLARVFTRTIGETPRAHARRLRLERAARQLRGARASILTIAIAAGFESHEAFTRAFQEHFGHTPLGYRRLAVATARPRAREQLWQLVGAGLRRHVEQ